MTQCPGNETCTSSRVHAWLREVFVVFRAVVVLFLVVLPGCVAPPPDSVPLPQTTGPTESSPEPEGPADSLAPPPPDAGTDATSADDAEAGADSGTAIDQAPDLSNAPTDGHECVDDDDCDSNELCHPLVKLCVECARDYHCDSDEICERGVCIDLGSGGHG